MNQKPKRLQFMDLTNVLGCFPYSTVTDLAKLRG